MFTDTDDLQRFIPVTQAFSPESLLPFIDDAAYTYVVPYLTKKQYDLLLQNGGDDELLDKVKAVIANFATLAYLPWLNVQASDAGLHRIETDTQKALFRYQETELKHSLWVNGFAAIEAMLRYLEEAGYNKYPHYINGEYAKRIRESVIQTADEFKSISGSDSRVLFWELSTYIQSQQDNVFDWLPPYIVGLIKHNTEHAIVQKMLHWLRELIGCRAMEQALRYKAIVLQSDGAYRVSKFGSETTPEYAPADAVFLQDVRNGYEERAKRAYTKINDYLVANNYATRIKSKSKNVWL
jgi:hypothetical protein